MENLKPSQKSRKQYHEPPCTFHPALTVNFSILESSTFSTVFFLIVGIFKAIICIISLVRASVCSPIGLYTHTPIPLSFPTLKKLFRNKVLPIFNFPPLPQKYLFTVCWFVQICYVLCSLSSHCISKLPCLASFLINIKCSPPYLSPHLSPT